MRIAALGLAVTLAAGLALEPVAAARPAARGRSRMGKTRRGPRYPAIVLYHVNRRDFLRFRPYDGRGRLRRRELRRFGRFMRDGNGRVGRIHPRLATLLYRVGRHYAPRRLEIVSGYRPRARNPRSPHRKGVAVDFRIQGVPNAELRDYLRRSFDRVGVGYYPNSVFVHFDVRDRRAFWIDYSGPGGDPVYAEDPQADLESGRAESHRPGLEPPPGAEGPAGSAAPAGAAPPLGGSLGAGEDSPPPGLDPGATPREPEPAP